MKPTLLAAAFLLLASMAPFASAADPGTPGGVPPNNPDSKVAIDKSTRHGEWVEIAVPRTQTKLKSFVVHPESKDKTPVVIVIHDIFGMSDWPRAVADQLAADGFIAIVPDLLSGKGTNGGGTESVGNVGQTIMGLKGDEVVADLNAVRDYGKKLVNSNGKTAVIGFCWGGGQSFNYATAQPELDAAVVYYGASPSADKLANIKAPVLGLYGGNDLRITGNVEPTATKMKELGKTYVTHVFDGAGHGFLRNQGTDANKKAATEAWPETIKFLKEHTK